MTAPPAARVGPGIRPWRLGLSTAQILLPATVVLAALVVAGRLEVRAALVAWLAAALISGGLAWLREQRLLRTRHYLNAMVEGRDPGRPSSYGPLIDDSLDAGFRRLSRVFAAREARVREADRLLSALLDALPDPLLVIGPDRMVLRANRAASALIGHEPVDRPLEASLRDPGLLAAADGALQDRGDAHLDLQLPGASPRAFAVHVVPVVLRGRPAAVVSLRELTSQLMIERMRSDFVANASHEIRTPLAAIIGSVETLQGPARTDAEARDRFLGTMAGEARRMARLVDDLLSLSRLEASAHQPPEGRVDVVECAQSVVEALQPYAAQRRVELELTVPDRLPEVRGERDQLTQLLTNLIDNAIKYGGDGKPVRIALDRLDAAPPGAGPLTGRPALRLQVADRGPGIAREHLPRLTERFFRVDAARSRALGGTGLGLAIVKHILRRHRGHLLFESELGQGTTVTVYLPA